MQAARWSSCEVTITFYNSINMYTKLHFFVSFISTLDNTKPVFKLLHKVCKLSILQSTKFLSKQDRAECIM